MKTHKLMIKTHSVTGLKYLCYTKSDGEKYNNYKGSGKYWIKHLKKYGENINTELIYESESYEDFKKVAIEKSIQYDIINSNEWANLKLEEGEGGDTVSNRMWITNGEEDKYIFKSDDIPIGWKKGRSNCIFNDSKKQKEFSKKVNFENRGKSIKKAWNAGKFEKRDHSKCGVKGDDNPAKRSEVKEKIRQSALLQSEERSNRAKENRIWEYSSRGHNKNNKN